MDEEKEPLKYAKKSLAVFVIAVIVCGLIGVVIPTKKDILIIFGLSAGSEAIKGVAEATKEISPKLLKLINKELDEALNEDK